MLGREELWMYRTDTSISFESMYALKADLRLAGGVKSFTPHKHHKHPKYSPTESNTPNFQTPLTPNP